MTPPILTVVTPAPSKALARLEQVREELGPAGADASDDQLRRRINVASGRIARYCGRELVEETVEEAFTEPRRTPVLILDRTPVSAVLAVTENDVALVASDFEVSATAGLLYRKAGGTRCHWPCGRIVVRYTGGYRPMDGLPFEIEQACLLLVTLDQYAQGRDPLLRSETVDGIGAVGYALPGAVGGLEGGMPGDVAALLDPYRRVLV